MNVTIETAETWRVLIDDEFVEIDAEGFVVDVPPIDAIGCGIVIVAEGRIHAAR